MPPRKKKTSKATGTLSKLPVPSTKATKGKGKTKGISGVSANLESPPPSASLPLSPLDIQLDANDDEDDDDNEPLVGFSQPPGIFTPRNNLPDDDEYDDDDDDEDDDEDEDIFEEIANYSYIDPNTRTVLAPGAMIHPSPGLVLPPSGRLPAPSVANSSPIIASQLRSSQERPNKRRRSDDKDASQDVSQDVGQWDVLMDHQSKNQRRLPTAAQLNAIEAGMRTPAKTVSFDDSAGVRRRNAAPPKPWQLQNYAHTPHTKSLYHKGRQNYRNRIITKNAWPTPDSRARFGREAWDQVIKENPELYANCSHKTFNNWVLRLFADTSWATRGALKTEAKKFVPAHYLLNPPDTLTVGSSDSHKKAAEFTKNRVLYLMTDYRFLYGEFNNHNSVPFANIALCTIIERGLFKNMTLEGRQLLNPMPPTLVALAATCVHNSLDEWSSGCFVKKPMKEESYGAIYRRYVKKLSQFQAARPNRFSLLMSSFFMFCTNATRHQPGSEPDILSDDDGWDLDDESDDDAPL